MKSGISKSVAVKMLDGDRIRPKLVHNRNNDTGKSLISWNIYLKEIKQERAFYL
jgi:hypothetical protein